MYLDVSIQVHELATAGHFFIASLGRNRVSALSNTTLVAHINFVLVLYARLYDIGRHFALGLK